MSEMDAVFKVQYSDVGLVTVSLPHRCLPHRCDEWEIADRELREGAILALETFLADGARALAALRAGVEYGS